MKGITPVVATVLLIFITVGAVGSIYGLVTDMQNNNSPNLEPQIGEFKKQSCWVDDTRARIMFRNTAEEAINTTLISPYLDGPPAKFYSVSPEIADSEGSFTFRFDETIGPSTVIKLASNSQSIETSCRSIPKLLIYNFEDRDPRLYEYNNADNPGQINTDYKADVVQGEEAGKAEGSTGACGSYGLAHDVNMSADFMKIQFKSKKDNWGKGGMIMIKNSSGYYYLWRHTDERPDGVTGWITKRFDLSNAGQSFSLIYGNRDTNDQYCDNGDHGWSIKVDNITVVGKK